MEVAWGGGVPEYRGGARRAALSSAGRLRCTGFLSARVPFGATRVNYQVLSLGIDLCEGMDFVAGEDALGDVGIAGREGFGLFQGVGLDDDEAAGSVGERPCEDHFAGLVQRVHPLEVGLAVQLALGLAVRAVIPDDDEDHPSFSLSVSMGLRPAYPSSISCQKRISGSPSFQQR